ncbi:hypothetical protein RM780_03980 [Streptomyces sp. DSM 44917]|uniref:Uncharacterized protein n=1 Tax=Streptomyces boetiae TaxID=3075541 RepID=A0ABU2L3I1_9ACTN|nr:hypothetical protein [Streptomyces sp. DSM 44917]MDT0306121.1 hypothetical protein [Streptomyces sp. DSM 44917]
MRDTLHTRRRPLAAARLTGPAPGAPGWAHPYPISPWSPLLYADGGDGGGDGAAPAGDPPQPAADTGQTDGGQGEPKPPAADKAKTDDKDATISRLEAALKAANAEQAKSRTVAKQKAAEEARQALAQEIGKALGLVQGDEAPDPAKLAEAVAQKDATIAEREAAIRTKDVELAVWARADKLAAKAGALLDSRSFLKAVADLDPAAKGFTTALDDAIKAAVKANPAYAATPPAGRAGGDLTGGTGESGARQRPTSLSAAVRGALGT